MKTVVQPRYRRRRWIAVAIVLFLGMTWWFSPRIDPRFVGTWDWTDEQVAGRAGVLRLLSDGTAVATYSGDPEETRTRWRVDGDRFLYGDGIWRQSKFVADVDSFISGLVGTTSARLGSAHWQIVRVEHDRIELQSGSLRWTLTRERRADAP